MTQQPPPTPVSVQVIISALNANGGAVWQPFLYDIVADRIADAAIAGALHFNPFTIDPVWDGIDGSAFRVTAVGAPAQVAADVSVAIANDPTSRSVLTAGIPAPIQPPKSGRLHRIVLPVLQAAINVPHIASTVGHVSTELIWRKIAHRLAVQLNGAERIAPPPPEVETLERALLIAFFERTRLPLATEMRAALSQLTVGTLGIRGSLLRIIERIGPAGNIEPQLPYELYVPVTLAPAHVALSHLLAALQLESAAIPQGHGFMHRFINVGGVPTTALRELRDAAYRQYEYSALAMMALAGIEFLIRTAAQGETLAGALAIDAANDRVIVLGQRVGLSPPLLDRLQQMFDPNLVNLRSKVMHGALLEIESRRIEYLRTQAAAQALGVPPLTLGNDPYMPENIAALALNLLARVDAELIAGGRVSAVSWTSHFDLTPADLTTATALHAPLITFLANNQVRQAMYDRIRAAVPALSMPVQLGVQGWADPGHGPHLMGKHALLMLML